METSIWKKPWCVIWHQKSWPNEMGELKHTKRKQEIYKKVCLKISEVHRWEDDVKIVHGRSVV